MHDAAVRYCFRCVEDLDASQAVEKEQEGALDVPDQVEDAATAVAVASALGIGWLFLKWQDNGGAAMGVPTGRGRGGGSE